MDTHDQKIYRDEPWDSLREAVMFIENGRAQGNVAVHCAQGKSRSTTIVVAYLMAKLKLGADGALKVVKSKRPEAEPNPAFMAQLREFQLSSDLEQLRRQLEG